MALSLRSRAGLVEDGKNKKLQTIQRRLLLVSNSSSSQQHKRRLGSAGGGGISTSGDKNSSRANKQRSAEEAAFDQFHERETWARLRAEKGKDLVLMFSEDDVRLFYRGKFQEGQGTLEAVGLDEEFAERVGGGGHHLHQHHRVGGGGGGGGFVGATRGAVSRGRKQQQTTVGSQARAQTPGGFGASSAVTVSAGSDGVTPRLAGVGASSTGFSSAGAGVVGAGAPSVALTLPSASLAQQLSGIGDDGGAMPSDVPDTVWREIIRGKQAASKEDKSASRVRTRRHHRLSCRYHEMSTDVHAKRLTQHASFPPKVLLDSVHRVSHCASGSFNGTSDPIPLDEFFAAPVLLDRDGNPLEPEAEAEDNQQQQQQQQQGAQRKETTKAKATSSPTVKKGRNSVEESAAFLQPTSSNGDGSLSFTLSGVPTLSDAQQQQQQQQTTTPAVEGGEVASGAVEGSSNPQREQVEQEEHRIHVTIETPQDEEQSQQQQQQQPTSSMATTPILVAHQHHHQMPPATASSAQHLGASGPSSEASSVVGGATPSVGPLPAPVFLTESSASAAAARQQQQQQRPSSVMSISERCRTPNLAAFKLPPRPHSVGGDFVDCDCTPRNSEYEYSGDEEKRFFKSLKSKRHQIEYPFGLRENDEAQRDQNEVLGMARVVDQASEKLFQCRRGYELTNVRSACKLKSLLIERSEHRDHVCSDRAHLNLITASGEKTGSEWSIARQIRMTTPHNSSMWAPVFNAIGEDEEKKCNFRNLYVTFTEYCTKCKFPQTPTELILLERARLRCARETPWDQRFCFTVLDEIGECMFKHRRCVAVANHFRQLCNVCVKDFFAFIFAHEGKWSLCNEVYHLHKRLAAVGAAASRGMQKQMSTVSSSGGGDGGGGSDEPGSARGGGTGTARSVGNNSDTLSSNKA